MPIYTYVCTDCQLKIEILGSPSNYQETIECEKCGKQCYRSLQDDLTFGFVKLADSEIKTLGHLAKRNAEKFSDDYKAELKRKHYDYQEQVSPKELPKGMTRIPKQPKIKWTKD
tara:strand:- start:40048 stop:40389 length:342 start_codon:yes stop_codon:yes gene_type:complete